MQRPHMQSSARSSQVARDTYSIFSVSMITFSPDSMKGGTCVSPYTDSSQYHESALLRSIMLSLRLKQSTYLNLSPV